MEIKVELTKNPKTKPTLDNIGFGKHFTDHMFVMKYETGKGWHDAEIKPFGTIELSPAAMALHYGQLAFEGLKAYPAVDGRTLLFRPEKNFSRFNGSLARICVPEIDEAFALEALMRLIDVDKDWIPTWEGTSLYIRPLVIATEQGLGVYPSNRYLFIIMLSPVGAYYPEGLAPVRICIEDEYVRSVRGGLGFTKAAANYAYSLKGQVKANEKGYTQVLWLDGIERKYIEEVGTMNVFFKINGEIVTPPLEGSILPGVTRASVIELLRGWGYTVTERRLSVDELYDCHDKGMLEEAFGTGTAAVISAIKEFNWADRSIQVTEGKIGPVSQRLYDEITAIQYGRKPDENGWIKEVR